MKSEAGRGSWRAGRAPTPSGHPRALTPGEIAWAALVPTAAVALVAILVLGPPLGRVLFPPPVDGLWPADWFGAHGSPEPVEQTRYLLAVLAPLLVAALVLATGRRHPALRPSVIRAITWASQALVLAFVAFAVLGQYDVIFVDRPLPHLFGARTLVIATAIALACALAPRHRVIGRLIARLARETPPRRIACFAIACAVAVTWLLEGVYTDALAEDVGTMDWTLNDAFAVLGGRTPLLDYHILYAKLLPYPAALSITIFGRSSLVYSVTLTLLSVLALIGVYAVLRRIARSSAFALALFVPFVAVSDVAHPMTLNPLWPMRYGGPYLLAWLTARHVDGGRPRRPWVVFFVAGFVVVNNLEFGTGALLASAAAMLCAEAIPHLRGALRLGGELVAGVLGAFAVISLLTLLRAGRLPNPALLLEWPRIFSRLGWFSMPMPTASLHLVVYATLAAAIVVAAVRLVRGHEDRLLTGMLAWSGVFGLVAGSYYVGVSDDLKLVSMFSAWGFALALLTVASLRALAARSWRRPMLAELLVLFGFGLAICSIVRVTPPQRQIERLTAPPTGPIERPLAERFMRAHTRRGETVEILIPMSYRIAYDLGLRNVSPYGSQLGVVTRRQLQLVIDVAHREGAHAIFVQDERIAEEQLQMLGEQGFEPQVRLPSEAGVWGIVMLSDA